MESKRRWRVVKRRRRTTDYWGVQRLAGYTDGKPSWTLVTPRLFYSREAAQEFIQAHAQTPEPTS